MFFLNESHDFVVLDYDFLDNPSSHLASLKTIGVTISILHSSLNDSQIKNLRESTEYDKLYFEKCDHNVSNLEQWLRNRKWTFQDIFISGSRQRVQVANQVAIGTILISDCPTIEDVKIGADLIIWNKDIQRVIGNRFYAGNFGEIKLYPDHKLLPGYKVGKNYLYKFIKFGVSNHTAFDQVYTLGRWFLSRDPFMNSHTYTKFIKTWKSDPNRFKAKTNKILDQALNFILTNENLENLVFTSVPKKPSDLIDRNLEFANNSVFSEKFRHVNLLKCVSDYTSQKDVSGFDRKKINVKDKYIGTSQIQNEVVVLFDDVYTSGSTLDECADKLLRSGASRVIPLTLAVTCTNSSLPLLPLTCTHCGNRMTVRYRKDDGGAFWSCEKWVRGQPHSIFDYDVGKKKLRQLWYNAETSIIRF